MKVIPIDKKKLEEAGIFHAPMTLYKWHQQGIHPELFVKLSGKLLLNLDEYNKWLEEAALKSKEKAKNIK